MNLNKSNKIKKIYSFCSVVLLACFMASNVQAKIYHPRVTPPVCCAQPINTLGWQQANVVRARASLSQTNVLQGSEGEIYVQVDLDALDDGKTLLKKRMPTNFVVVLDRSGSMGDRGKMEYARSSIVSLIRQLKPGDGFALVTFDSYVETPIAFTKITATNANQLIEVAQSISPRGSTDLGSGLQRGIDIISHVNRHANETSRLMLISDGLANVGITDNASLNNMASQAVRGEFVLSTIGVGLDFNETLMASLADFGTGNYYFLESANGMDCVLTKEFFSASELLAKNLKLQLNLAADVQVLDASGYPVTTQGLFKIVQPGHLYRNQSKTFFLTLKVPTNRIYSKPLGEISLSYEYGNQNYRLSILDKSIAIACLSVDRKAEVLSSIDQETYSNAWAQNNVGRALKDSSDQIREGNYDQAKAGIKQFRKKLEEAYQTAPSPVLEKKMQELEKMDDALEQNTSSGTMNTETQKSMSKSWHYQGSQEQRKK